MTRLTATQRALLADARRRRSDLIVAESYGGQGPNGGLITGGRRNVHALSTLIAAGLATLLDTARDQHSNHGYTATSYTLRATLTDAGRTARDNPAP